MFSKANRSCTYCGKTKAHACSGVCGGRVAYCNRECQRAHNPIHEKFCWKKAPTDTITIRHPRNRLDLGLKAYHQKDGFGCSGLVLMYSDHLGEERTRPHVIECFGEYNDAMGWNIEGLKNVCWGIVTSPVHGEVDRASLEPGEAVFNMTNAKVEVIQLMSMGIITWTGKLIKIGNFPPHPVCRINLPLFVPPRTNPNGAEETREETEARIEEYERQRREYYKSIYSEEAIQDKDVY